MLLELPGKDWGPHKWERNRDRLRTMTIDQMSNPEASGHNREKLLAFKSSKG